MDPLHITEFASPRYFEKVKALNDAAAANAIANGPASTSIEATLGASQSNQITLPLGNPRPRRRRSDDNSRPDDQKREKLEHDAELPKSLRRPSFGGFLSFRSKVSIPHKAPPLPFLDHQRFTSEAVQVHEPVQQHFTRSLNDLFLSLPNELQVQIITPLPMPTILNLRLVSKAFHNIVALNEAAISRHHVSYSVPSYALRLYPTPDPSLINLQYLCGIWHRLHVAQKLAVAISEHTTREIFLRDTEAKWKEFLPQHTRMRQRLMPLIFTIFHFLERSREIHVQHLEAHGVPLRLQAFTLNPIEKQVMDMYDDDLLLRVHQAFPLVISAFSRRLRPPSYAGRLERSFKGMLKDKPADEIYATILAVGGLRQAERFWQTKGYNTRRAAVDTWYGFVTREPLEVAPKSKLSLFRKKDAKPTDAVVVAECTPGHDPTACQEWYCVKTGCSGARGRRPSVSNSNHIQYQQPPQSQLITTSLSLGPPMSPLSREQLRLLLPDLQPLHNIWLLTGEAVVLDRQIVDSSSKIKRNTQVLLELIKEDGPEIEEWAPGLSGVSRRDLENFTGDMEAFHLE